MTGVRMPTLARATLAVLLAWLPVVVTIVVLVVARVDPASDVAVRWAGLSPTTAVPAWVVVGAGLLVAAAFALAASVPEPSRGWIEPRRALCMGLSATCCSVVVALVLLVASDAARSGLLLLAPLAMLYGLAAVLRSRPRAT